ncbi:hypothetical protein WDU94_000222 [Cyamophila willieti]
MPTRLNGKRMSEEVKQDVYTNGLKAHQKRMEHIFNNPQYSDTEFTVQKQKFYALSQYMYGLDINFSELTMHVLCGVINLAETFKLDEFAKDLKTHLSKIDKFEMDSLAILLSTSRKYNLDEMYKKLKEFAFEHAEEFVNHNSIVSLLYEVLLDLIKSDGFSAPEIDILKAILSWHTEMNSKDEKSIDEDDRDVES